MNTTPNLVGAFESSLMRLDDALKQQSDEWVRDAAVHRFKVAFEFACNAIIQMMQEQGLDNEGSLKQVFKTAFKLNWLEDVNVWLNILKDCNLTNYTYDAQIAESIFGRLPGYRDAFKKLLEQLKKLEENNLNDSDSSKGEPTK